MVNEVKAEREKKESAKALGFFCGNFMTENFHNTMLLLAGEITSRVISLSRNASQLNAVPINERKIRARADRSN